jgi:hypothetical protein
MELELNEKIFQLNDEGFTAGKIAQKLRVKKAVVQDVLGDAANKGLGDTVEAITKATGIKAIVESLTDDCGCAARKESLNKLFPNRNLNDLSNEDYDYLANWFKEDKKSVRPPEQLELVAIYNRVFNSKRKITNCGPCLAGVVRELKEIFINV